MSRGGCLFRRIAVPILICLASSSWATGPECKDAIIPGWAKAHVSPKPLGADLIAAVEKLPEFEERKTKIMVPIAAGASTAGVDAVISRAKAMKNGVELHMWVNGISPAVMNKVKEAGDKVTLVAHFLGPNMRELYRDDYVQLVPGYLGHFAQRVHENHPDYQFDIILTRVSREADALNFGANSDMIWTLLHYQSEIKIIAEVNSKVPVTYTDLGMNHVPMGRVLATFESDSKLAHPEPVVVTPVEAAIGENVASLIPDGATLQIGIGNIFGGLPAGLRKYHRQSLGIWTEMMGDVLQEVMVDGIAKTATIGFGFGSQEFYNWLNKNPQVRLTPTMIVNDPKMVASIPKFHAVNTALQVSLTGEVNATTGTPERGRISSPGGQVEFLMGASWSKDGKSIIVIRSTATLGSGTEERKISSIVPRTYPVRDGTPNAFVSHIVTEFGIAEIRGKSEKERAIALIRIAHPDFREQLFNNAIKLGHPDRIPGLRESDRARALGGLP